MLKSQQRKVRHMIEQVRTSEAELPQGQYVFVQIDYDMCVYNFCCCFLVIIAAAKLPHRHSGEGSIHQRSGGEGGFPGGRGQGFLSYAALVRSWISVQWSTLTFIIRLCLQNREMHDHMEYFLAGQDPPPHTPTEKPEVVYR